MMIKAESNAQIRNEKQYDYNWFSSFFDVIDGQKTGYRWFDEHGNDLEINDPDAKLDDNGAYNGVTVIRVPVIAPTMKQAQTDEDFEYIFNRELKSNCQFSGPTNLFAQYLRDVVLEKKEEYVKSNKPSQINIQIIYIVDRFIQWLDTQTENKNSSAIGSQTHNIKIEKTFTDHIISEKENRKILNVLHQLIDGRKGKDIAFVILALIETGMIVNPRPRNVLYKSMRDEFGDIGSNASINDVLNPANEHKRDKTTIDSIVLKLREIK